MAIRNVGLPVALFMARPVRFPHQRCACL